MNNTLVIKQVQLFIQFDKLTYYLDALLLGGTGIHNGETLQGIHDQDQQLEILQDIDCITQ